MSRFPTASCLGAAVLLSLFDTARAGAQEVVYVGRTGQLSARVPRLEGEAAIDGLLSEAQWSTAALLTGFSAYLPFDNRPAADSTEVRIWYTERDVFFGIRAWEPHGKVHATLAARDRIDSDDYVQLLLDPFNDRRRAFVFGVNPLGVQSDGIRTDGGGPPQLRGTTFGGNPPASIDLSPDFQYDSKGHLTDFGYEIEVRVPLKSIRFQGANEQTWSFQVLRFVQHSGYQQTWTPARRGSNSFLSQSGTLTGLYDLRHDQVVEINPELTGSLSGAPRSDVDSTWRYTSDPALGGNVRWRIVPHITLNGTIRPDFSQVEADAAQIPGDTRFSLFFPEKRPFFVDGIEQYETPNNLIYTRQIVQPEAAVKLGGKIGRTNFALLSAVDNTAASLSGTAHPVFNILRMRRDLSGSSTAGLTYTDRIEGKDFNRVASADARFFFRKTYSLSMQGALSSTRSDDTTRTAPLLDINLSRTGYRYGLLYAFQAFHPDFRAASGFVPRVDFVHASFYNRFSWYWKPGSFLESWLIREGADALWLYDKFRHGDGVQETKLQAENVLNIHGGWVVSITPVTESFLYDPRRYADYAVLDEHFSPGGSTPPDTVAFTPGDRTSTAEVLLRVTTPQYRLFSGRFSSILGRDVDFFETAPAHRTDLTADIDFRPSSKLRLTTSYLYSVYTRWRNNTTLSRANVPRLKLEYQLGRPLFVRFVGQYDNRVRDALKDPRTDRPIVVRTDGVYELASTSHTRDFRVDWLVSFVPNPGTVIFAGYGASLTEPEAFRFNELRRVRDGFFVKFSYLFRR